MGQLPSLRFSLASPIAGLWLGLVVLAVAACPHETTVVDPTPPDTTNGGGGGGGGGTVQRATLTVTVTITGQDSALAELIGSADGRLSEAEMTIARIGSEGSEQKDTTDADGVATFSGLLGGSYNVSAIRLLTGAEIAQLGAPNADVNAFGGGGTIAVTAPTTERTLAAVAARRGSLVLSEWFGGIARLGTQFYYFAGFAEVYNNNDTTIYLDGKMLAHGPPFIRDIPPDHSCDQMAQWQLDPEGIWVRFMERFPGTGRDYPLPAGQAAVVAIDGCDRPQTRLAVAA